MWNDNIILSTKAIVKTANSADLLTLLLILLLLLPLLCISCETVKAKDAANLELMQTSYCNYNYD